MIKINLLDPNGKKQKVSEEKEDINALKKKKISKSSKSKAPKAQKEKKNTPPKTKKPKGQKKAKTGVSSKSQKSQNKKNDKPPNNGYYFGFDNNDIDEPNEEDSKINNDLKFKKSYIGWVIVLLIIVLSAILYFSLSGGFFKKMKRPITKKPTKIEPIVIKDVDSVETEKIEHIEKKIANVEGKIVSEKQKDLDSKEKSKYKYLRNRINNSSRRLKVTSKLFKYIPNGLDINYLSVSKNELSFELISNKNDIIDRFFGLLRKDKDFYDVKFKSIDNRFRFSKRGSFKVKFKKPASTTEGKLKNLNVNNFIDYIALTADKSNLSFREILKNDSEVVSSPLMKKNKLKMEFGGNLYQIREFFNKMNKIPGSFDVENIEIRNVDNWKYYKIILRILLFEKA